MGKTEEVKKKEKENIIQKMFSVTKEIGKLVKDMYVDDRSGAYMAISEKNVLDAVKPLEEKAGIYSYPMRREEVESQVIETVYKYGNKSTVFYTKLKTTYRFVNIDEPEDPTNPDNPQVEPQNPEDPQENPDKPGTDKPIIVIPVVKTIVAVVKTVTRVLASVAKAISRIFRWF